MLGGREGHRKRAASDTMALQDERVDSTVEGVPPYIVRRYNTGILWWFPPSRNAQCERVDFDIDSVAKK
jgi:hypothetical protein